MRQDYVDRLEHVHGLLERGPGRGPVVEDERPLIHDRHEAGLDMTVGNPRERDEAGADEDGDPGVRERPAEAAGVGADEPAREAVPRAAPDGPDPGALQGGGERGCEGEGQCEIDDKAH